MISVQVPTLVNSNTLTDKQTNKDRETHKCWNVDVRYTVPYKITCEFAQSADCQQIVQHKSENPHSGSLSVIKHVHTCTHAHCYTPESQIDHCHVMV